ncbi:hypothetical protein [Streptomyces collinus]|uniref:hypothetical protein n=1 Tax=Streptomyces collinus TaxID=42684 RepID=UPI002942C1BF|nr:hypothetical protein [Streptomyces collinus]
MTAATEDTAEWQALRSELRMLKQQCGLPHREIGPRAWMSYSYPSLFLTGERFPSPDRLSDLVHAMGGNPLAEPWPSLYKAAAESLGRRETTLPTPAREADRIRRNRRADGPTASGEDGTSGGVYGRNTSGGVYGHGIGVSGRNDRLRVRVALVLLGLVLTGVFAWTSTGVVPGAPPDAVVKPGMTAVVWSEDHAGPLQVEPIRGGTKVPVLGCKVMPTEKGELKVRWVQVRWMGVRGWVSADLLEPLHHIDVCPRL